MGEQTAQQFTDYFGPTWIPPGLLRAGGLIDAYSEFASARTHRTSDYVTVDLVRLASDAQASALAASFEQAQTDTLTPAPGGGTVKRVRVARIPGSQAYLSWFEGSADMDIVFVRGGVVVDLDRTTPSRAVADDFVRFAEQMYRNLEIGPTTLT